MFIYNSHHIAEDSGKVSVSSSVFLSGSPSLTVRGQPRKKKPRDAKDPPTLTRSQSESWMDKMKV